MDSIINFVDIVSCPPAWDEAHLVSVYESLEIFFDTGAQDLPQNLQIHVQQRDGSEHLRLRDLVGCFRNHRDISFKGFGGGLRTLF